MDADKVDAQDKNTKDPVIAEAAQRLYRNLFLDTLSPATTSCTLYYTALVSNKNIKKTAQIKLWFPLFFSGVHFNNT